METPYLLWFALFGVVAYMMAVDENVAEFVNLFFLSVWVQLKKYYYMAILHPRNPITNWIMERKMRKLAEELMAEYGTIDEDSDEQRN